MRRDATATEPVDVAIPVALAHSQAYPGDPTASSGVEVVQTHISWVFLTGERVYKLRKDAVLSFVDFGSRGERNADCLREVRLNRRLAPDVYLGVAPIERTRDGFAVGTVAEEIAEHARDLEHCVVMRRLPTGRDGLALLSAGRLAPATIEAAADVIARFHAAHGLGAPAPFSGEQWLARIGEPIIACIEALREAGLAELPGDRIAAIERATGERLARHAPRFEARRRAGRAVDGHGDLHLQHLWLEPGRPEPLFVDCLEFDAQLRHIDAASDVAFLAMDLAYRGHPELGEHFLRCYAARSDDFDLYGVVDDFAVYRALVRAKVAALAAADDAIPSPQRAAARASADRHLSLAEAMLARARRACVVLTCGPVGSGKSTLASALADDLGAVVIASDRVRKARIGPDGPGPAAAAPGQGLYTPACRRAVYAAMLERAEPVVASGRSVVLDATFGERAERERVRTWASRRGHTALLFEARCPEAILRDRLTRRQRRGGDASDAGPSLLPASLAGFEAPGEWPAADRFAVHTDRPDWRESVRVMAGSVGGAIGEPPD